MNCDDPPNLAWTQQDLYIPQPTSTKAFNADKSVKVGTIFKPYNIEGE